MIDSCGSVPIRSVSNDGVHSVSVLSNLLFFIFLDYTSPNLLFRFSPEIIYSLQTRINFISYALCVIFESWLNEPVRGSL